MKLKKYEFAKNSSSKVFLSDYETRTIIGGASIVGDDTVELNFEEMIQVYGSVGHFPTYIQETLGINTAFPSASELNALSIMTFEVRLSELDPFFISFWGLSEASGEEGSSDYVPDSNDNLFEFVYNIAEDVAECFGYSPLADVVVTFRGNLYTALRNEGLSTSTDLSYTLTPDENINRSYTLVVKLGNDEIYNDHVSL